MSTPDVAAFRVAVDRLTEQVAVALDEPPETLTAARATELVTAAMEAYERVGDIRDALTALARNVGASWAMLEDATGSPDSTLHARMQKWEGRR